MSRKKKILLALALAGLALLVLVLMPSPVAVSAERARKGYFAEHVEDEGRTRLRDPHVVLSPIDGFLRRVELEPGDRVEAGDLLFEVEGLPAPALDPRARQRARESVAAAGARVRAAEAELSIRRREAELAETELERSRQLFERDAVTEEELDRHRMERDAARAAERAARSAVDVARAELASARAELQVGGGARNTERQPFVDVRSPVDGTVTRRPRETEGPVASGAEILELGDLSRMEVRVDLLSTDAARVRPGMRAILERWGGGDALEGRVRRVEPSGFTRVSALGVDEQRVPVLVDITSPRQQWAHLGDGYRVEARIVLWEGDDVLHVPTSALVRDGDRWAVFVVEGGRASLRAVTPGRQSGLRTQITGGLEAGEVVITHPGDRVEDGTRVSVDLQPEG